MGGMRPEGGSNVQLYFTTGSLIAVYMEKGACVHLNCS